MDPSDLDFRIERIGPPEKIANRIHREETLKTIGSSTIPSVWRGVKEMPWRNRSQ